MGKHLRILFLFFKFTSFGGVGFTFYVFKGYINFFFFFFFKNTLQKRLYGGHLNASKNQGSPLNDDVLIPLNYFFVK
jgi:hypothetical protein